MDVSDKYRRGHMDYVSDDTLVFLISKCLQRGHLDGICTAVTAGVWGNVELIQAVTGHNSTSVPGTRLCQEQDGDVERNAAEA